MKVVKPITITDEMLISSSVPETDYPAWNAATSYAVGDKVIRTTTHRIYVCLVAGVNATAPESNSTKWLDYSPTNRWACFDSQISTETIGTDTLAITLQPGATINAISLINVTASSVAISISYGGSIVYTDSKNLDRTAFTGWYDWFFRGRDLLTQAIFTGIPPYGTGQITITLTGIGTVSCGVLVVGNLRDLGITQRDAKIEIFDYSVKSTDEFGTTTFVKRKNAKKIEIDFILENARLDATYAAMALLCAVPSVWIISEENSMELLNIFGWYSGFTVVVQYATHSMCTLQIQGLT